MMSGVNAGVTAPLDPLRKLFRFSMNEWKALVDEYLKRGIIPEVEKGGSHASRTNGHDLRQLYQNCRVTENLKQVECINSTLTLLKD